MGYCWYCHWGWPKAILDIYKKAKEDIDFIGDHGESCLEFGPAHIVWSDENWEDANIDYCIGECYPKAHWNEFSPEVFEIIKRSLEELKAIPLAVRLPSKGFEEECDGNNDYLLPENFPPTEEHGEMIRDRLAYLKGDK